MEIGKLPPELLEKMILNPIANAVHQRSDIAVRPKTGEDCSAVHFEKELCVLSTDPITGAKQDTGYLAVHVNCNDIAAAGAEPIGVLLTILLPPSATEETLAEIMSGAQFAAAELGIEILGGHTEVTAAVNQPVLSATAIGRAEPHTFVSTGGAKAGQDLLMTKWAGLEGTVILAQEAKEALLASLPEKVIMEAEAFSGYLSVLPEARYARKFGATAMHDATEGGVLGAVWEIADCSGLGVDLYLDQVPVREETRKICEVAEISPYELISSGTLLVTAFDGETLVRQWEAAGIEGMVIGKITDGERIIYENGTRRTLLQPKSDALYRSKLSRE